MILADFGELDRDKINRRQLKKKQNNNNINNNKSYGANCSINELKAMNMTNNTNPRKTMGQLIDQLGVPGVKQAYSIKQQQKINEMNKTINKARQQYLQQSIDRLYSTQLNKSLQNNYNNKHKLNKTNSNRQNNQMNTRKQQNQNCLQQQVDFSQHQHQAQRQSEDQLNNNYYYNQLYQLDAQFDHQFRVRKLQKDCKQFYTKLKNTFIKRYNIWVAINEKDKKQKQYKKLSFKQSHPNTKKIVMLQQDVYRMFVNSIVMFLFNYLNTPKNKSIINNNNKTITTNNKFITLQDEFFIAYSDFINHYKRNQWSQNNLQQKQQQNHMQQLYDQQLSQYVKSIAHKLPFVYFMLDYEKFQQLDQTKIKTTEDVYQWVMKCFNQQKDWGQVYKVFANQLNVKFTVPFETKLYQVNKLQQINKNINKNNQDDQKQTFQPFKANPIPQSTYRKPKQSSQSQTKKSPTQPVPFNFTRNHSSSTPKLTQQQYYSWNRQFKAKPIPKTLYQPQIIGIPQKDRQQYKKQHQQKLFNQARFPKTMNYLEKFNQFQSQKKRQLQQKYQHDRLQQRTRPKQIPDFEKMHKRQINQLQARKQMNRTCTQPKPFKFTQTKKQNYNKTFINSDLQFYQQKNKKNSKKSSFINTSSNIPEAKTTAKFDAYVELRKQQKQEKIMQIQQREKMKKRQQQDKKKYKDILRQRMQNQLLQQPKAVQYSNGNNSNNVTNNMVKVNLQEIYIQRPLLMQSLSGNKQQQKYDDKKTCFTDTYEPII